MRIEQSIDHSYILKNLRIISAALIIIFLFSFTGCKYLSYEEDSLGYGVTLQGENLKEITLYLPFPYYQGAPFKEVFEALKENTEERGLSDNVSLSLVETKYGKMLEARIKELNGELSLETEPMKFKDKLQTLGLLGRRGVPVWLNPRIVGGKQVPARGQKVERIAPKGHIQTALYRQSDRDSFQDIKIVISFPLSEDKRSLTVFTGLAHYQFVVPKVGLIDGWATVSMYENATIR